MARKVRDEKNPVYFQFVLADTLKHLAVYMMEANNEGLAWWYIKQIVDLLACVLDRAVETYYDEDVWVPVYKVLMEFTSKDPYNDAYSEFVELKGLEELSNRLKELVKGLKNCSG